MIPAACFARFINTSFGNVESGRGNTLASITRSPFVPRTLKTRRLQQARNKSKREKPERSVDDGHFVVFRTDATRPTRVMRRQRDRPNNTIQIVEIPRVDREMLAVLQPRPVDFSARVSEHISVHHIDSKINRWK